jgi:hypothetical protein
MADYTSKDLVDTALVIWLALIIVQSKNGSSNLHEPIKEKDHRAENQSKPEHCLDNPESRTQRPPADAVKPVGKQTRPNNYEPWKNAPKQEQRKNEQHLSDALASRAQL